MGNWNYCGDATYESSAGRVWLRAAPLGGVPEWMAKPSAIRLVLGPYRFLEDAQEACASAGVKVPRAPDTYGKQLGAAETARRIELVTQGLRDNKPIRALARELGWSTGTVCRIASLSARGLAANA